MTTLICKKWCVLAVVILGAAAAGGCASTKGKSAKGAVATPPTREEFEAQLRALVDEDLARARKEQGVQSGAVVFKRPYYFKQYFEYPGNAGVYTLEFTEKQSRTTPLTAEFEVEKVRYATKYVKDHNEARVDGNYFRSRGIDYVSYELRSGRWRKIGDLFQAKSTEENKGGEWKQVLEKQRPRAVVVDEPSHWYDRLKFWKKK